LASEAKGRGFDPRQPHQQIPVFQSHPVVGEGFQSWIKLQVPSCNTAFFSS
jgi:hypothetical protein